MGLVKLTVLDLRSKVPKIQGPGVAISPLLPVLSLVLSSSFVSFLSFFFMGGGGGGRGLSLFQVHLLIFLGPPVVFIPGAFFNPIWTLKSGDVFWEKRRYATVIAGGRAFVAFTDIEGFAVSHLPPQQTKGLAADASSDQPMAAFKTRLQSSGSGEAEELPKTSNLQAFGPHLVLCCLLHMARDGQGSLPSSAAVHSGD